MATSVENGTDLALPSEGGLPLPEPVAEERVGVSARTCYRLEGGRLISCDPSEATVIVYSVPTVDDEAEMQELYNIDFHTLQSSLDPDELSRLEFEADHAAIIFKRPKSFCADDNFLLKLTSTGVFVYEDHLVIVMPDEAPIFEGRVPFPVQGIQDVILRLLYQTTLHFEGHLKAINMLSESLERRISTSLENRYLLNMFALEKSLVYIINSIGSNGALLERMKTAAEKLGFDREQSGVLEDLIIENQQCYRRSEIYAQVIGGLMDARASIVSHNLNQLIKKFTIWTIAIMLANLIVSIFSMNVKIPGQDLPGWTAFLFINILAVGSGFAVLWLWKVRKW